MKTEVVIENRRLKTDASTHEAAIEKLNTDDPQVERFRPINAHTPISGIGENALPSWVSKVVGDG